MKKTITLLTSLCISASALLTPDALNYGRTANAYTAAKSVTTTDAPADEETSGTCGEGVEWMIDNGVLTISGKGVIAEDSFAENSNIKSVIIKDGVTGIGKNAFGSCTGLTSVKMPESLTFIAGSAFDGCNELSEVVMSKPVEIGSYAFSQTKWLQAQQEKSPLVIVNGILIDGTACSGKVTIPDNVTSIADCAFSFCDGLTSAVIPKSVKTIGQMAFLSCMSLESVTIPDSVASIGESAFSYTKWLENKQSESPLVIVNDILIDGTTCTGDVVIPNTVREIAGSAFSMSMIESVSIPATVKKIGNAAFDQCGALASVTVFDPECEIAEGADTIDSGLDEESGKYKYNGVICGYKGSKAEAYAKKNNYTFKALSDTPVSTTTTAPKTTTTSSTTTTSTTSKKSSTSTTTTKATTSSAKTSVSTTSKAVSSTTTAVTTTAQSGRLSVTVWGDLNGNGKADIADLVALNKRLNDPTYPLSDQAIVNADICDPQDPTGKSIDPKTVRLTAGDSEKLSLLLLKNLGF